MKKGLIMLALLMVPVAVSAQVPSNAESIGANTDAKSQVDESLKLNESIKNVTSGYYIEGIEVTCSNNKYVHTIYNESIKDTLTCANGNTAPYLDIKSDGTGSVASGNDCNTTDKLYASRIYLYDCRYTGNKDNKQEFVANNSVTVTANTGLSFTKTDLEGTITTKQNTGNNLSVTCSGKLCSMRLYITVADGYEYIGPSIDNCATISKSEDVDNPKNLSLKPRFTFTSSSTTKYTLCSQATGGNKDTGTTDNKDTGVEDYFVALGSIGIAVICILYVLNKKNVFKNI